MTRTRFAVAAAVAALTTSILALPAVAVAAPGVPSSTAGSSATVTTPDVSPEDISWGG